MIEDPGSDDVPILALRQALHGGSPGTGVDDAVLQSVERRTMCIWSMELAVVVFGWVLANHIDFVKSLGSDERNPE